MSKSRTISWVLLAAAIAGLGYYGWSKYNGEQASAQADAQKRAPPAPPFP